MRRFRAPRDNQITSVQDVIFNSAKAGETSEIRSLLRSLSPSEVQLILGPKKHANGERTTPLLVAAMYSHDEVVDMLIQEFNTDVEQIGLIEYDGHLLISTSGSKYYISQNAFSFRHRHLENGENADELEESDQCVNGVTALWIACLKGFADVVKTLVTNHGADINRAAMDGSTPLRVACVNNYTNIVQYLIEHGADVNSSMKDNSTPLMLAALYGNRHEVKLLVKSGAAVNTKTQPQGRTALHYAAQGRDYLIVINLMRNGAEFYADLQGFTPIHVACMVCDQDILEYLLQNFQCPTKERIEAQELLGAGFIKSDPTNDELEECWEKWREAMEQRYADMENIIHKRVMTDRSPIYDKESEVQSLEELLKIKGEKDDIMFEALMLQERILGENTMLHPNEMAKFLTDRGSDFASGRQYVECHAFWLKAIAIRKQADQSVSEDIMKFGELFEDMEAHNIPAEPKIYWNVLDYCIADIQNESYRLRCSECYPAILKAQKHVDQDIYFMLFILNKLRQITLGNDEKTLELTTHVRRFNQLNISNSRGNPLLHILCDNNTSNQITNHYIRHAYVFPNVELIEFLLESGTDPNILNMKNETALHILAQSTDYDENAQSGDLPEQIQSVARLLLDYGIHIDGRNNDGLNAFDLSNLTVGLYLKRCRSELPLKCLSAQIVKQFVPNYEEFLPEKLNEFVRTH